MSHDEAKTDQLAPAHLDGTDHRTAFSAAALCRVRRPSAPGEAVASRGRARKAARATRLDQASDLGDTLGTRSRVHFLVNFFVSVRKLTASIPKGSYDSFMLMEDAKTRPMPQVTCQYRGYIIRLERRGDLLLVSVSPATSDLPILHRCLFEARSQSEVEALSEVRYRVDRVLAN